MRIVGMEMVSIGKTIYNCIANQELVCTKINMYIYSRYPHIISSDMSTNPEFPQSSTSTKQNSIVSNQLYTLKNVVAQLRNAFNGHDVEWTDVGE